MGISCGVELPFVFEMSQTLMVILVEHSRKVGDLISVKLFAFFLWKASAKWLQADAFTLGFCHWMWSVVFVIPCETEGGKIVLETDVAVAEMQCPELWSDTALWNYLVFYCFNLTGTIRCLSLFARQEKGWFRQAVELVAP